MDNIENAIEGFFKDFPEMRQVENNFLIELAARFFLVHGVKIGGRYRHFKGVHYFVESISRDADCWGQWLVTYVEETDVKHKATRKIEWFLGFHESGPRRFELVQTSIE